MTRRRFSQIRWPRLQEEPAIMTPGTDGNAVPTRAISLDFGPTIGRLTFRGDILDFSSGEDVQFMWSSDDSRGIIYTYKDGDTWGSLITVYTDDFDVSGIVVLNGSWGRGIMLSDWSTTLGDLPGHAGDNLMALLNKIDLGPF